MDARHHVIFSFALPPALLLHAEPGVWPRSPRGCTVTVGTAGAIEVRSVDHSVSYATDQVLRVAAAYLRATVRNAPPLALHGVLSSPHTRRGGADRPACYSIVLGARVAITHDLLRERVVMAGDEDEPLPGDEMTVEHMTEPA